MKKALSVFLMTAMAFGAFAEEPVADVNIAEFSGNAAVQWGVDLDSGTTGFQNSYEVNLKLNLLNNGTKSTTGDGVWGELVLKTDGDSFIQWQNKEYADNAFSPNKGMAADNSTDDKDYDDKGLLMKVYVDVAKIHIGPAYIGIKAGDTQTGKLKMDAPIRSADSDNALTLDGVGPANYSQGIVAGYDSDMFKVDLDLRSKPTATYYYTDDYAAALEGEFKGVENLSIKAGASYNFASNYQADTKPTIKTANAPKHTLGYSASVGYKLGLNDTFYVRPQIGFAGSTEFDDLNQVIQDQTVDGKKSDTTMKMAGGLLLGWGETADANAGVYFLDNDDAKKVTPGVGVVMTIPLPSIHKFSGSVVASDVDVARKEVKTGSLAARIVPSFFSGELIPGLTMAAYADIWLQKDSETKTTTEINGKSNTTTVTTDNTVDTPMAFAFGVKYALGIDEMTITPQLGMRFMNAEYVGNNTGNKLFDDTHNKKGEALPNDDYLNLKLGVDVAGLVDNTTLSVVWSTRNLINDTDLANVNDPKLGTLDFKAKIAL